MTATNGSVSIEVQWPAIPPPLNDVTNNTGLQDTEDNNNGSPTAEKHDPILHAAATVSEAVTVDGSLLSEQQQQQKKKKQGEESVTNSISTVTNHCNDCYQSNGMDKTTTDPLSFNNNTNNNEKTSIPSLPSVSETATQVIDDRTPQKQNQQSSCDLPTTPTTPIVVVGSIPCKRTCEDPSIDYPGDTDVKRARAYEPASLLLSSSSTIAVPQPKEWCRRCGTSKTPRWRGGPLGSHTLCNACGLRWKNVGKPVEGFNNATYPPPELPDALKPKVSVPKPRAPKSKDLQARESKARKASQVTVVKWEDSNNNSNRRDILNEKPSNQSIVKETVSTTRSTSGTESNTKHTTTSDNIQPRIPNNQLLRRRKQFLIAGMYSSTYKELQPAKGTSAKRPPRVSWKKGSANFTSNEGGSRFRIPLPIHQGEFILNTEQDFTLPADIFQEHTGGRLRAISSYTKIKTNIYVGRRACKTDHQAVCQCEIPPDGSMGCGEDCLNRMLFYECDPKTCPCAEKCANRRFQLKKYISELEPVLTTSRGWGLRTLVDVKKGQLITEYRGEVITHQEVKERMNTIYKSNQNFYFLDYCNGEVIDAGLKGSEARFINHSCDPNCHIEKWGLKGELFVGVFASRDINTGEELFYDYNFSTFGGSDDQLCHCGSSKCRGTIGKKPRREN